LAAVISDLTRENRQLAEAATAWQIRAMQAEARLTQLTAGDEGDGEVPDVSPAVTGATETPEPGSDAPAHWWLRFWRKGVRR